ncbi:MAG: type II secretion system GspH family protein [Betaproteobacteria bacterium]|nr:type II secretion system GspH family protein [Betaproteobacteria bacterium]
MAPAKTPAHARISTQSGFTLMEVVVAMMLVGIGFAMALSAMSGSLRLSQRALEYDNAMLLANSKLDEILASPTYDVVEETSSDTPDVYGGVAYSYRIEINPVPILTREQRKLLKSEMTLNEIHIVVHWGGNEETVSRVYELTAYRLSKSTNLQDDLDDEEGGGSKDGAAGGNAGAAGGSSSASGGTRS